MRFDYYSHLTGKETKAPDVEGFAKATQPIKAGSNVKSRLLTICSTLLFSTLVATTVLGAMGGGSGHGSVPLTPLN